MIKLPRLTHKSQVNTRRLNDIIDRLNSLGQITGGNGIQIAQSNQGVRVWQADSKNKGRPTIFSVYSNADGNGLYNCYKQIIDNGDWDSTSTTDILDNFNTDAIKVFNLGENEVITAWASATDYRKQTIVSNDSDEYRCILGHTSAAASEPGTGGSWETYWTTTVVDHQLSTGDLLLSWQVLDDEGVLRWVGTRAMSIDNLEDMLKDLFDEC